jgi:hypothetical protein
LPGADAADKRIGGEVSIASDEAQARIRGAGGDAEFRGHVGRLLVACRGPWAARQRVANRRLGATLDGREGLHRLSRRGPGSQRR